jgi:signal transduction histidine kinase
VVVVLVVEHGGLVEGIVAGQHPLGAVPVELPDPLADQHGGHRVAGLVDPHHLVTIVGNLADNAIDAAAAPDAPRPRWVRIGAEVVAEAAAEDAEEAVEPGAALDRAPAVVLRIADSGPGVAAGDVERVFGRGWTTKRAVDGRARGIGLALVERAVRRHGGDVRVSTERGSEFVVRLPLVVT